MEGDSSGNLYIADHNNAVVRKVGLSSAFLAILTDADIPSADPNGLGYIMSSAGHHKRTIDLDTGVVLYEFDYDDDGNLAAIIDRFGNESIVERNEAGLPTAIISPDGIRTTLTIDSNNHLTRISYPDGSFYSFEYTADGLMTAKIEPEGNRFGHVFDGSGRLINATDEEGGNWQYSRITLDNGDTLTRSDHGRRGGDLLSGQHRRYGSLPIYHYCSHGSTDTVFPVGRWTECDQELGVRHGASL